MPLTDTELGTTGPIYLWFYILKEAELRHNGGRLGPVGALIVTEVLRENTTTDHASQERG